jgi:hypothetical protein
MDLAVARKANKAIAARLGISARSSPPCHTHEKSSTRGRIRTSSGRPSPRTGNERKIGGDRLTGASEAFLLAYVADDAEQLRPQAR